MTMTTTTDAKRSSDAGRELLAQFVADFGQRQDAAAMADHSKPVWLWQDSAVFLDNEIAELLLDAEFPEARQKYSTDDLQKLSAILDYWRNSVSKALHSENKQETDERAY